jgi:hypothetical protein
MIPAATQPPTCRAPADRETLGRPSGTLLNPVSQVPSQRRSEVVWPATAFSRAKQDPRCPRAQAFSYGSGHGRLDHEKKAISETWNTCHRAHNVMCSADGNPLIEALLSHSFLCLSDLIWPRRYHFGFCPLPELHVHLRSSLFMARDRK